MFGTITVVTLTPSRGLIHSRTVAGVLAALAFPGDAVDHRGWLLTHDLPIPDAHEILAEQGLATSADYLWFVEEDVVPEPETLLRLINRQRQTGAGVIYQDYPVGEYPRSSSVLRQPHNGPHNGAQPGAILYGGLGCTLITRRVLETLPRPWFDTAHEYALSRSQHDGRFVLTRTDRACVYGGHDVAFACAALAHGFTVADVPEQTVGHAKLRTWGKPRANQGAHGVDVLRDIERVS